MKLNTLKPASGAGFFCKSAACLNEGAESQLPVSNGWLLIAFYHIWVLGERSQPFDRLWPQPPILRCNNSR